MKPRSRPVVLVVLLCALLFGGCHVMRSMIFLRPDHTDHKRFPSVRIEGAPDAFTWADRTDDVDPSAILITKRDGTKMPFEEFLRITKTHAFLIADQQSIFFEDYRNGYGRHVPHTSFSVSKGMVHASLGIAIERGHIESLDHPVTDWVPELADSRQRFERVTLRHLLTMTSGIRQSDREASLFGDLAKMYYGSNFMRYLRSIRMEHEPGTVHEYKQIDTALLALVLRRATGSTLADFFERTVWQPIGARCDATWSVYDRDRLEKAFCCFTTCVRDFARFGKLYLQNGLWGDRQIVPADWIERTTFMNPSAQSADVDFCNHWFPAANCADLTAQGFLGQMIYINRAKNILILRFGNEEWDAVDWEDAMRQIVEQLGV